MRVELDRDLGSALPLQQSGDFVGVDLGIGHVTAGEAGYVEAFKVAADLAIPAAAGAGLEQHGVLSESAPRRNYFSHVFTYSQSGIYTTLRHFV